MQKEKQQKTQQEKIQKIFLYMKKTRFLCNTKNCFASISSKSTTHCTFCFFENKKKEWLNLLPTIPCVIQYHNSLKDDYNSLSGMCFREKHREKHSQNTIEQYDVLFVGPTTDFLVFRNRDNIIPFHFRLLSISYIIPWEGYMAYALYCFFPDEFIEKYEPTGAMFEHDIEEKRFTFKFEDGRTKRFKHP